MSEADFIKKWMTDSLKNTDWGKDAHRVFWARSYCQSQKVLLEMSQDFLSITPLSGCSSSLDLAQRTIDANMKMIDSARR